MAQYDVAVVVNLHREGTLAHPTLRSLARSVTHAQSHGRSVEVVVVLDRGDAATRELAREALTPAGTLGSLDRGVLLEVDNGDLGSSRNDGIAATSAPVVGTLDGDNLVSENWVHRAATTVEQAAEPVVVHPAYVVIFDGRENVWPVQASTDPTFRPELLYSVNYWDAFCMTRREVFETHPYVNTHAGTGLGPEDWHWNCTTLASGIDHVRSDGTTMYYRSKRVGSLADRHTRSRSLLPPTDLLRSREIARRGAQRGAGVDEVGRDEVMSHVMELAGEALAWPEGTASGVVDADAVRTRRPLTEEQVTALQPEHFNVAHYRLLHADLSGHTYDELVDHYLDVGHRQARAGILTDEEVEDLVAIGFDAHSYVRAHPDLQSLSPRDGLRHYLAYGRREGRSARPDAITLFERELEVPSWMLDDWRATHDLEPLIQYPTPEYLERPTWTGHAHHLEQRPATRAYWALVDALPDRIDALFLAPWVRLGGGDQVLLRYIRAYLEARPGDSVVLLTTEPQESTHLHELPEDVVVVDLATMLGDKVTRLEAEHLLGTVVVQYAPSMMHVVNSPLGFDTVEVHGRQMAAATAVFVSTFVIERSVHGELSSPLLRRAPDFLDHVTGVIVDHAAIVDQLHELYRVDRRKFLVHHQAVASETATPVAAFGKVPRTLLGRVGVPRILWTARFDRQKRLDVLADVAEGLRDAGVRAEIHFHGEPVIVDEDLDRHLERLEKAGAVRHPPFTGGFRSLPLEQYSAFLLTSEWEGIPLLLLDAASSGIPIVAPLVGGIPEVLDSTTGFPVSRFDAVEEYVEAIRSALADPGEARRRGLRAAERVSAEFSWAAFEERVRHTPGYLSPAAVVDGPRPQALRAER